MLSNLPSLNGQSHTWGGDDVIIFGSLVLAISFFGLEEMARRVSNPFAWDAEGRHARESV